MVQVGTASVLWEGGRRAQRPSDDQPVLTPPKLKERAPIASRRKNKKESRRVLAVEQKRQVSRRPVYKWKAGGLSSGGKSLKTHPRYINIST